MRSRDNIAAIVHSAHVQDETRDPRFRIIGKKIPPRCRYDFYRYNTTFPPLSSFRFFFFFLFIICISCIVLRVLFLPYLRLVHRIRLPPCKPVVFEVVMLLSRPKCLLLFYILSKLVYGTAKVIPPFDHQHCSPECQAGESFTYTLEREKKVLMGIPKRPFARKPNT